MQRSFRTDRFAYLLSRFPVLRLVRLYKTERTAKSMTLVTKCFFFLLAGACYAQRSPYAGRQPIGYPQMDTTPASVLQDRFGTGESATTQRLPVEALGDRELVDRISKLPVDQQPFWYINWQALEQNRKNPQTYQPNPNPFAPNSN
ncbi:hypothetical protein EVAR_83032_1 [Eumeta japonica]|uniref:Uncharacterized protein n=1 Tax=Eumeta variegata TaxID=151549 RepID=A0A4C1VNG4_EUMVA|nr:hypothetical protein EVAR_83032_1 [Eumeta japonica]